MSQFLHTEKHLENESLHTHGKKCSHYFEANNLVAGFSVIVTVIALMLACCYNFYNCYFPADSDYCRCSRVYLFPNFNNKSGISLSVVTFVRGSRHLLAGYEFPLKFYFP